MSAMSNHLLYASLMNLKNRIEPMGRTVDVEALQKIILTHACAAGAAAAVSGWLPGAGALAATAACSGFVVAMYVRLCRAMGIKMGQGMLRTLASILVADLSTTFAGSLVASTVTSLFPGLGSIAATVINATLNFGCVYIAAIIFARLLAVIYATGQEPERVDKADLEAYAKGIVADIDMKAAMKEARGAFDTARKNGELNNAAVEPIN